MMPPSPACRTWRPEYAAHIGAPRWPTVSYTTSRDTIPVFQTCFQEESSLPAFQTAIEDTIAALNTGVWRTREGETIRRIPSLHHLRNPQVKAKVRKASELVDKLRRTFIAGLRDKTIRPCGCGNPSCPTFMIDRTVAASLDNIRKMALDAFREAYSPFDVHLQ